MTRGRWSRRSRQAASRIRCCSSRTGGSPRTIQTQAHSQLERLHTLRNCWIIYDDSSFPQLPRTPAEQASFDQILGSMDELIKNVVILASPDYLTRGWLVFEYLVASLGGSIVCDEVGDPAFAGLRDWFATEAPATANPYRDSWESQQVNHINRMKLSAVNDVLPLYQDSRVPHRARQQRGPALLVRHLKQRLPPRKRPQDYVGEWETVPWTDDDAHAAFRRHPDTPTTPRSRSGRSGSMYPSRSRTQSRGTTRSGR